MVKLFYGNDTVKVREEALAFIDAWVSKESGELFVIDTESYQTGILLDSAEGESLFGGNRIYLIDTPSSGTDFYDATIESLPVLVDSKHQFVIVEGTILAGEKKKFTKYVKEVEEHKSATSERFNTFALADALANKDKKKLWLLFSEARLAGIAVEEVLGVLWWQLKSLRLASLTTSASEAGMKDFPYNKAKRSLGKFKDGELDNLSHSLLKLQHDSRLGKMELDLAVEQWLLKL